MVDTLYVVLDIANTTGDINLNLTEAIVVGFIFVGFGLVLNAICRK